MNVIETKKLISDSLRQLIGTPNMRPFVFRTRFERNMIRLSAYARETQQTELYSFSQSLLKKMQCIIDKSNTTSDGTLRSYVLLVDDMKCLLNYFE